MQRLALFLVETRLAFAQRHAAGVHRFGGGTQTGAGLQQFVDQAFFLGPALLQGGQALALLGQQGLGVALAFGGGDADGALAADDRQLGFQRLDAPAAIVDLGRHRVQADGGARAGGIQQAHRLVRQLARRDVAVRQPDRRLQRLVEDLHLVVLLHGRRDAAHHQDGLVLGRLVHLHHLETPGQRRVLLDVLLVLGPGGRRHGAQGAARQGRLEQVGGVAGAGRATGADQGVGFVDEQDDRLLGTLHVFDHLAQALLELALHARPGLQQADVEGAQFDVLQRRRDVAGDDAQGEAFHHRGLADAGLAGEDRVVLPAAHEDVHQLADLLVTPDDGVELAATGLLGEVHGKALERLLLAHRARRQGAAGLARGGAGVEAVAGRQAVLRRGADVLVEALGERLDLELGEFRRQPGEGMAQARRLEDADHQVAGAHLALAEHQAAVDPAALHRFLDMGGQVGDRGRAARQAVEGLGQVLGQARRVDPGLADDLVQVRVRQLEDLVEPVHQLDIGIAAQLAEYRGGLDGLVGQAVQLAEQRNATDLTHVPSPCARAAAQWRTGGPAVDPWRPGRDRPARC